MNKYQSTVSSVAEILGVTKVSWSRAMKVCREAYNDGFTNDDFVRAAQAMIKTDKQYWSLYSVFLKTDYWLSKAEPEKVKGVW